MFRNIYIESYKRSIQQNNSLQVILIHANHMYAGLGCILQDIQFMVGNVMAHLKNKNGTQSMGKNQSKERKLQERIQDISYKLPKFQFLPSSSMKYEQFDSFMHHNLQPEKVRKSHEVNKLTEKKNDSLQEMFTVPKRTTENNQNYSNENRPSKTNDSRNSRKEPPPPDSQQDFMDYLFKKK